MSSPIINNSDWDLPPRGDKVFNIRVSRNTLIALLVSICLHMALLWIFAPKLFSVGAPIKDSPPFEVSLGPPQKKQTANVEPALPTVEPISEPSPEPPKPMPKKIIKQKSVPPKQVTPVEIPVEVAKKSDLTLPKKPEKTIETTPEPLPGEDMQAYIKRQKEAKLAQQGASNQDVEEVLASNNAPSEGEKRDAKIRENLKFDGTNGIFEIRDIGIHTAQFSFKGWKTNVNTARLEIIDVNVPDGADARREVIKKMIEIIRREYSGDFNWDSRRLGRVLVLSARLQDNDALEDFMLTEFFGSGTRQR
jgi:hypothetical protein